MEAPMPNDNPGRPPPLPPLFDVILILLLRFASVLLLVGGIVAVFTQFPQAYTILLCGIVFGIWATLKHASATSMADRTPRNMGE
jgi:TRAP-type mannitol/chloroaromatic compound transport system permease large subunit